jgi:hypothetical protein
MVDRPDQTGTGDAQEDGVRTALVNDGLVTMVADRADRQRNESAIRTFGSGFDSFQQQSLSPESRQLAGALSRSLLQGDIKAVEQFVAQNRNKIEFDAVVDEIGGKLRAHDLTVEWSPERKNLAIYRTGETALRSDREAILVDGSASKVSSSVKLMELDKIKDTDRQPAAVLGAFARDAVASIHQRTEAVNSGSVLLQQVAALKLTSDRDLPIVNRLAKDILGGDWQDMQKALQDEKRTPAELERITKKLNEVMKTAGVNTEWKADHGLRVFIPQGLTNGIQVTMSDLKGTVPAASELNSAVGQNGIRSLVYKTGPYADQPVIPIRAQDGINELSRRAINNLHSRLS